MEKEIEQVCLETGIGMEAWTGTGARGKTTLVLTGEKDMEKAFSEEGERAEGLVLPQQMFEKHVLHRRSCECPLQMKHVRVLRLLAEKEKVSLYFLQHLAEALPALKLICLEGEGRYILSVDRDERANGYRFMVFSRSVEKVTQFYTPADEGEFPLLCLPGTQPGRVCRPYRVHLMIPFFAHPEWYRPEEREVYRLWLQGHGRQFFQQALEEGRGELLEQALSGETGNIHFTADTYRYLSDVAYRAGNDTLASILAVCSGGRNG